MTLLPECASAEDRTAAVLAFTHRGLLSQGKSSATFLEELAAAYDAQGAGVVAPLDGSPTCREEWWAAGGGRLEAYPWEKEKDLVRQAGQAATALVVRQGP